MTAGGNPADEIMHAYWELFMEEQVSLEDFCQRLADGEFGQYSKEHITVFLNEVEASILQNIDTMLEANPQLAPLRDERIAETQEMIADLLRRFGSN